MIITTKSAEETIKLGRNLSKLLKPGDVLGLIGELGSGKTTLVRGIASGLGVKEKEGVASPTFVLVKEYRGKIPVFHLDLYRLDSIKDIESLGVEEYLFDQGVCLIEWAEKMRMLLPDYLQVNLKVIGESKREIGFRAHSKRYQTLLNEAFNSRHIK